MEMPLREAVAQSERLILLSRILKRKQIPPAIRRFLATARERKTENGLSPDVAVVIERRDRVQPVGWVRSAMIDALVLPFARPSTGPT